MKKISNDESEDIVIYKGFGGWGVGEKNGMSTNMKRVS